MEKNSSIQKILWEISRKMCSIHQATKINLSKFKFNLKKLKWKPRNRYIFMIMGELIREFYAFCSKHYSFYKFIDYNKNLCFQTSFFFILIRFLWYYKYKHGEIKRVMLLVLIWCRFSCSWSVIYVDDN